MRWALYVTVPPAWFDPGDVVGVITPFWILYALHDALVKPMPGNHLTPSLAESWTVSPDQKVYEFKLRQGVKFHNGDPFTAEDVKFSFHRAKAKLLHEKVKDVVIADPAPGALRAARAVARLHDLLRHLRVRGRLGRAQEIHRAGGRGGLPQAPDRARALQVREHQPGHRAGHGGLRGLLAQDAVGEASRLQERARRHHAAGHAQAGRGGPRVSHRRPDGRGHQAGSQPQAGVFRWHRDHLSRLPGHVGSQVALARQARAAGGEPGHRPPRPQRRGDGGGLHSHRQCGAEGLRVRHPHRAGPLQSRAGQAAPRRGGLSKGVRRGRSVSLAALLLDGGDGDQLPRRHRHQDAGAHHGARGLLFGPGLEEAQGALRVRQRRVRQCGLAPVRDRARRGQLRLRRLAGHRGALRPAGARDRSEEARGHAPADPAAAQRARALCAHLRLYLAERGGAAGGGARAHADQSRTPGRRPSKTSASRSSPQDTRRSRCSRCG